MFRDSLGSHFFIDLWMMHWKNCKIVCLKSFHRKFKFSKIYFYIVLCIVGWSVELHNLLIRSLNYDWILSSCKFIYENCQQFNFFFERLGGRRKSGHAPVYRDVGRHLYPSHIDVGYMLCNLNCMYVCMLKSIFDVV